MKMLDIVSNAMALMIGGKVVGLLLGKYCSVRRAR